MALAMLPSITFLITIGYAQPNAANRAGKTSLRVYVPIKELNALFREHQKGVFLAPEEFEKLSSLAETQRKLEKHVDVPFLIQSAEYVATLSERQMTLVLKYRFHQLHNGWHRIPLPLSRVSIEKAELDGEFARLGQETGKGNSVWLLNNKKGAHTLELHLATSLVDEGSDQLAAFGLIPAPSGNLKLTLPAGKDLLVDQHPFPRPLPHEQPATFRVPVGGKQNLQLRITDRRSEQSADALLFANTVAGLNVTIGEVTWQAQSALQVFGTPLEELKFSVPKTLEIADVQSTGLEAWELNDSDDGKRTEITLKYRQAFEGQRNVIIRGVMAPEPEQPWQVPNLQVSGATSHVGKLLIRTPPGIRVSFNQNAMRGIRRQVFERSIEQKAQSNSRLFQGGGELTFAAWRQDFQLEVQTQFKNRELLMSNLLSKLHIEDTRLRLETITSLECFYAPLFELNVTVPAEWNVTSVLIRDQPVTWKKGTTDESKTEIVIPVTPPLRPGEKVQLTLMGEHPVAEVSQTGESIVQPVQHWEFPQADFVQGTLTILAHQNFDVQTRNLEGLDPVFLEISNERASFQFQKDQQQGPFQGEIEISRKPSRISAESLTFFRLEQQTVNLHLECALKVEGGGTRELVVKVPSHLGENLRFHLQRTSTHIVEQSILDLVGEERRWKLRFDRYLQGSASLWVTSRSPRSDREEFSVPALLIEGAERSDGYLAIEASGEQRMKMKTVAADQEPLVEVDPVDLPLSKVGYHQQERIVGAFQYVSTGFSVVVSEDRFARPPIPTAISQKGELKSLLDKSGEFQHHLDLEFVAVSVQSLRVVLPASSQMWGTFIDDVPVEVRRSQNAYLIAVPAVDPPDKPRLLKLFYRTAIEPLDSFGTIQSIPPQITVISGQGTEQPLDILNQSWNLSYPKGTHLLASKGVFQPSQDLDRTSLLGELNQRILETSPKESINKVFILVAVSVIAILMLLFIRRYRGWGVGILVSMGIVLFCFLLLTMQFQLASSTDRSYSSESVGSQKSETPHALEKSRESSSDWGGEVDEMELDYESIEMPNGDYDSDSLVEKRELDDLEKKSDQKGRRKPTTPGEKTKAPKTPELTPRRPPVAQQPQPASDSNEQPPSGSASPTGPSNPPVQPPSDLPGDVADNFAVPPGGRTGQSSALQLEEEVVTEGTIQLNEDVLENQQEGGLLSVMMDFELPHDQPRKSFQYNGTENQSEKKPLVIQYEEVGAARVLCFVIAAGILLLFWCLKRKSFRTIALLTLLGMVIPVACILMAPPVTYVWLDGIFLGTVMGVLLVMLFSLITAIPGWCRNCCQHVSSVATRSPFLFLAGLLSQIYCSYLCSNGNMLHAAPPANLQPQIRTASHFGPIPPPASGRKPTDPLPKTLLTDPHVIVVPYQSGTDPLSAKQIFLPHQQFWKLWSLAHPEELFTQPAPVPGIVAAAIYSVNGTEKPGKPVGTRLTVHARYVLYSFRQGQIRLPVPLASNMAIRSAMLDQQQAPLRQIGGKVQSYEVLVHHPGRHLLDVVYDIPAKMTSNSGEFTLSLKPVPTGRLTVQLPAKDLAIDVQSSASTYRRVTDGNREQLEIPVGSGGALRVKWRPAATQQPQDLSVDVDSRSTVSVSDIGMKLYAGFRFHVSRGELNELSFTLPENLKLRAIMGPDVGGWKLEEVDKKKQLKVFLRKTVSSSTELFLELYRTLNIDDITMEESFPFVQPVGISSLRGSLGVAVAPQMIVRSRKGQGVQQINREQFQPFRKRATDPIQIAYRLSEKSFSLPLLISRREAETSVVSESRLSVESLKTRLASYYRVTLKGTPRSRLTFRLPYQFRTLEVKSTSMMDWHEQVDPQDPDIVYLILELRKPKLGLEEVSLVGVVPKSHDDDFLEIDLPILQNVTNFKGDVGIWFDDSLRATPDNDALMGWRSINPNRLPERTKQQQSRPANFAYQTDKEPGPLMFDLEKLEPELNAETVSVVTVTDTFVSYWIGIRWTIRKASAETFQFTGPRWLSHRLSFPSEGIRQIQEEALNEERVRWTLSLKQPQRKRFFIVASTTIPLPEDQKILAPEIFVDRIKVNQKNESPLAEIPQRHYQVLVNQSRNRIAPENLSGVESISHQSLPFTLQQELIKQATDTTLAKTVQHQLSWTIHRAVQQKQVAASVKSAQIVTVIAKDGSWRAEALYHIRNRARQFLPLTMPEESRILSVLVKEAPSHTVTSEIDGQTLHFIPLPKTSIADLPFKVRIVFSGQLPEGVLDQTGRPLGKEFEIPAPQIVTPAENQEFGIAVSQTNWKVYFPEEFYLNPLDDPSKNNLTQLDQGSIDLSDSLTMLNTAEDLFQVLEGPASSRARFRALSNLKQIEKATRKLDDQGRSYGSFKGKSTSLSNPVRSEAWTKRDRFLKRWKENEKKYHLDHGNQKAIVITGETGLQQFEAQEQQQEIHRQRRQFYLDNSGSIKVPVTSNEESHWGYKVQVENGKLTQTKESKENAGKPLAYGKNTSRVQQQREQILDLDQRLKANISSSTFNNQTKLQQQLQLQIQQQQQQQLQLQIQQQQGAQQAPGIPNADPFAPSGTPFGNQSSYDHRNGTLVPGQEPRFGVEPGYVPQNQLPAPQQQALPQSQTIPNLSTDLTISGDRIIPASEFPSPNNGETASAEFGSTPTSSTSSPATWSESGGLSLKIALPTQGQSLQFTKVGGKPKLVVRVIPNRSLKTGYHLLWICIWAAVLLLGLRMITSKRSGSKSFTLLVLGILAIGLLFYFGMDQAFAVLGLIIFLLGLVLWIFKTSLAAHLKQ